jgi:hypothetical protein
VGVVDSKLEFHKAVTFFLPPVETANCLSESKYKLKTVILFTHECRHLRIKVGNITGRSEFLVNTIKYQFA